MKIKHWQGYGFVNAECIKKQNLSTLLDTRIMRIKVKGNHEWGLLREDAYDVKRWLLEKFDKSAKELDTRDVFVKCDYLPDEDGVECALYEIAYGKDIRAIVQKGN